MEIDSPVWNRWWASYGFAGTAGQRDALRNELEDDELHAQRLEDYEAVVGLIKVPIQPARPPTLLTFPAIIIYFFPSRWVLFSSSGSFTLASLFLHIIATKGNRHIHRYSGSYRRRVRRKGL